MTRGLTTAAAAIVSAEVAPRTLAVSLDFPSGIVRLNGSPADITIDGQTYLGIGGLGGVSIAEESAELRAYDLTLTLSGVPNDVVALALAEAYQGRAGTVWEVPFNASWQPVDPFVVFRGRMDQMAVSYGQTSTVTVTLQNRMVDWERAAIQRYTNEDQQRLHPGDAGLSQVPTAAEVTIVWPAAAWWDRNR